MTFLWKRIAYHIGIISNMLYKMKKIKIYFTLFCFLIVSQIQLIHAIDMWDIFVHENKMMYSVNHNTIHTPLFCDSHSSKQTHNDCSQDIVIDKWILLQNKVEWKNKIKFLFSFYPNKIYFVNKMDINIPSHSFPFFISSKSNYIELIWIVKHIN